MSGRQFDIIKLDKFQKSFTCHLSPETDYGHRIKGHLLNTLQINGDLGLVTGYICFTNQNEVIQILTKCVRPSSKQFINIEDIPSTYASKIKEGGMRLTVEGFTFYNVALSRYKSSATTYHFMGQICISDLDKFKQTINEQRRLK